MVCFSAKVLDGFIGGMFRLQLNSVHLKLSEYMVAVGSQHITASYGFLYHHACFGSVTVRHHIFEHPWCSLIDCLLCSQRYPHTAHSMQTSPTAPALSDCAGTSRRTSKHICSDRYDFILCTLLNCLSAPNATGTHRTACRTSPTAPALADCAATSRRSFKH